MATLHVRLFGSFQIMLGEETAPLNVPPSARTLLAFLLLQSHRALPRDTLAAVCWGERPNEQARACLNTALWRLRRALAPANAAATDFLLTNGAGEVGFNWDSDHWLDLTVFELQAAAFLAAPTDTLTPACIANMESAVGLYSADLLEGFYEDWALQERERLRLIYLSCLARLMQHHARQDAHQQGLNYGQLILRHDPLREEVHRQVMRLHWRAGERDRAVRQYQLCREVLAAELGIPPMPETEALFAQIVAGSATDAPFAPAGPPAPAGLQDALRSIADARARLAAAHRDLNRAERLVLEWQANGGGATKTARP